MKRVLFVSIGLMISAVSVFGQKTLKVTASECPNVIIRCVDPDETGVEVQSDVPLTFESTVDKEVRICNTKEESGFYYYYLAFKVESKFRGRKLIIKSYGYLNQTEPLELKPKVPICMYVDGGIIPKTCWEEHWRRGNDFFVNTQYEEAKAVYYLAFECEDLPVDNDLSQRIEDCVAAIDSKRAADSYYNSGNLDEALTEYEKVYAINSKDAYAKERINVCKEKIPNQPRVIRGIVTNLQGAVMSEVKIEAEFHKDKNGKPKTEWRSVGTTDKQGRYTVTVLRETTKLKFSKDERSLSDMSTGMNNSTGNDPAGRILGGVKKYLEKTKYRAEVQITNDEIDVVMKEVIL